LGRNIAVGILSDATDAVVNVGEVFTQVNSMPIDWWCLFSGRPAKDHISWHICRSIVRVGLFGLSRRFSEAQRIVNRRFNQCISVSIK
jgi:hypothetical protein